MINYFVISEARMQDPRYLALSPAGRLYVEYIVSEYSLRGPFYKSDLEVAVTLGVKEDTIRRIRRQVGRPSESVAIQTAMLTGKDLSQGHGWVVFEPGWKAGSKVIATRYIDVPVAMVPEGGFFACVHRYTFECLLHRVRIGTLVHGDIVAWLVLAYLWWRYRGAHDDGRFFVQKDQLRTLTGLTNPGAAVHHLYEQWTFTGGAHLFEVSDRHQRFQFTRWSHCSDPSEDENARKLHQQHRDDIRRRVKAAKSPAPKRAKSRPRAGVR